MVAAGGEKVREESQSTCRGFYCTTTLHGLPWRHTLSDTSRPLLTLLLPCFF